MSLLLTHRNVAVRDCNHCKKWMYNEETGEVETHRGQPLERNGKPPCEILVNGKSGCPKGSPTAGIALSDKNLQAFIFHRQCKAVGFFPNDPIVIRNAGIIQSIVEAADKQENAQLMRMILMSARR